MASSRQVPLPVECPASAGVEQDTARTNNDTKNSVVAQAHLKGRKWEPKIAAILSKHAKEGTVAIDMGAYIGTHTMSLVDGVGKSGKVILEWN